MIELSIDHPVPELIAAEDASTIRAIDEGIAQLGGGQGISLEELRQDDYIARDNRDAAERFFDALLNHADLLGTFPHIGAISAQRPDVRSVLHKQYVGRIVLDGRA